MKSPTQKKSAVREEKSFIEQGGGLLTMVGIITLIGIIGNILRFFLTE